MADDKVISEKFLFGNSKIAPTDEKLKQDALSLCEQYCQYWDPGEVEVTVILSRPDAKRVIYGTSVTQRDRLIYSLDSVKGESIIQSTLVKGGKGTR